MADDKEEKKRGEDLSKRGMKDGKYRSGSFKKAKKKGFKVANLKKKQVRRGKAGGKNVNKKQAKAAQSNTVDISKTKFTKGEGVTVDGKLFTGNVKLASGKTAHYVNGRRVMSGPPKPKKPKYRGGSGGSGGSSGRTGQSSSAANRGGATAADYKKAYGKEPTRQQLIDFANKRWNAHKKSMSNAEYIRKRKEAEKKNKSGNGAWRTSSKEYRDALASAAEKKRQQQRNR
jgi:hypothetical protein